MTEKIHTVQKGDSFWKIANANNTSVEELKKLNPGLDPKKLQIGAQLVLLGKQTNTSSTSKEYSPTSTENTKHTEYKIKKGDTLSAIAKKHGCSLKALMILNGLDEKSKIYAGKKIILPSASVKQSVQKTQNDKVDTSDQQTVTQTGLQDHIKNYEGTRPQTYLAPEGKATIGVGHQLINKPQFIKNIEDNKSLALAAKKTALASALKDKKNQEQLKIALEKELKAAAKLTGNKDKNILTVNNLTLTNAQIKLLFDADLQKKTKAAKALVGEKNWNEKKPNEQNAFLSLLFNVGEGKIEGTKFLEYFKAGKIQQAAQEMDYFKSNGKILTGLINRRENEMLMMLGTNKLTLACQAKINQARAKV